MSYLKITSFAIKDALAVSDPNKIIRGKEFDDEFNAIAVAIEAQAETIKGVTATPTGGVIMFGGATAPAGFLLCDGAERSRRTYAALFQAIGTSFGVGDSSNTFNVPNLIGRFPYGGQLGQLGGVADTVLPAHTHSAVVNIADPGHAHNYLKAAGSAPQSGSATPCLTGETTALTSPVVTGITATATIQSAGVTATNANLPPFIGMSFIIKT